VDYVLTISISIAAAGDAIFSFLPPAWSTTSLLGAVPVKLVVEFTAIAALILLNLRGVRESVIALAPLFLTFLISHAILIGGLILAYLIVHALPDPSRTMNAVLANRFAGGWILAGLKVGTAFVLITLLSEAMLLLVAGQAGFIDGPRVMANMAVDSYLPHRF